MATYSLDIMKKLISCIDLTQLNNTATESDITALCQSASTSLGSVASVCVFPKFVSLCWKNLISTSINITTVANFPEGNENIKTLQQTIQHAILSGAHEIDIVIPDNKNITKTDYNIYLSQFIKTCKETCQNKLLLKIILETGRLSPEEIIIFGQMAIDNGADFLKTSTGKIPIGATPEAAMILLKLIKQNIENTGRLVGLKISGGIKTIEQALIYSDLFKTIIGEDFLSPQYFRIGASNLLQEILSCASQNLN